MRTSFEREPDWSGAVAKDFICDRGYRDRQEMREKMQPAEEILCDTCERKP